MVVSSLGNGLLITLPYYHVSVYTQIDSLDIETDTTIKILGFQWNPPPDSFTFSFTPSVQCGIKRSLLSAMSRISDPNGFLLRLLSP